MKIRFIYIMLPLLFVLSSCEVIKEAATFAKCEFRMGNVEHLEIVGINIQDKQSISDLSLLDAAKLTKAFASSTFPVYFVLNVEAKNPNQQDASLSKMDWIAFVDNVELVRGVMDDKVEIAANNGQVTVPINISADLTKVINKDSKDALLNLAFNLVDASNKPSKISLKIKPSVNIGSVMVPYPGYFTVSRDFGAN